MTLDDVTELVGQRHDQLGGGADPGQATAAGNRPRTARTGAAAALHRPLLFIVAGEAMVSKASDGQHGQLDLLFDRRSGK